MSGGTTTLLVFSLGILVLPNLVKAGGEGLKNKHLIIEGEIWRPFFMYDIHENGSTVEGTYRGVMWDLLLFMQKARNFTFTMVNKADWVWGECFSINNCTGMIGMVNRKEVDFAIGKVYRITKIERKRRLIIFQDPLTLTIPLSKNPFQNL